MASKLRKQIALGVGSLIAVGGAIGVASNSVAQAKEASKEELRKKDLQAYVPSRKEILAKLKSNYTYDMLIIGGGATGSGIALDATTRGLNVALVEKEDFAAATSSRSTKLIHGGVRYLEAAFKKLDPRQLSLVFDALHERASFLENAPHLTRKLPIMTPCYAYWEIPYYWFGLKMYDMLSLNKRLASSRYVSRKESLLQFPMLANKDLKGSVVYYDGQMDDSRMNVGLAVTAAVRGASVANHVEVVELLKKEEADGKFTVCGAKVRDTQTGEVFDINARVVVNATGPYVDRIREMDDPSAKKLLSHSRGVHVILPDYYSPTEMGLIIPKTVDGRVIFVLPWLGKTIAGTTDTKTDLDASPKTEEPEINYVLDSISKYVSVKVRREDVSATWSGIRPLVTDPDAKDTAAIVRDHFIESRPSNLITITGGKWTTYRTMAQELVDKAIEVGKLSAGKCVTDKVPILGAGGWDKSLFLNVAQNYYRSKQPNHGKYSRSPFNKDIAEHLSNSYGTRALLVAELAQQGFGKRLAHNQPYIEAEVVYAARYEYACTAVDLIARRLRLAFLDSAAAHQALPRTVCIMAQELGWDAERQKQETEQALAFLNTMN